MRKGAERDITRVLHLLGQLGGAGQGPSQTRGDPTARGALVPRK